MKPYELLRKAYYFHKYTRKLIGREDWRHQKYYQTEEGVNDAILYFRSLGKHEYPGTEYEAKLPEYRPMIIIYRYRWVCNPN